MSLPPWLAIHCRNFPTSRISDLETEFPLLLLANAGFAIAVGYTIIPTTAIASIAKIVVFVIFVVFIMLYSFTQKYDQN
jgi:hypothetical protein